MFAARESGSSAIEAIPLDKTGEAVLIGRGGQAVGQHVYLHCPCVCPNLHHSYDASDSSRKSLSVDVGGTEFKEHELSSSWGLRLCMPGCLPGTDPVRPVTCITVKAPAGWLPSRGLCRMDGWRDRYRWWLHLNPEVS
jgi:hypothetical protein